MPARYIWHDREQYLQRSLQEVPNGTLFAGGRCHLCGGQQAIMPDTQLHNSRTWLPLRSQQRCRSCNGLQKVPVRTTDLPPAYSAALFTHEMPVQRPLSGHAGCLAINDHSCHAPFQGDAGQQTRVPPRQKVRNVQLSVHVQTRHRRRRRWARAVCRENASQQAA